MTAETTIPAPREFAPTSTRRYVSTISAADPTNALSIRADYLRTGVDLLQKDVVELHGQFRERDLASRTVAKAKKGVADLLEELTGVQGMAWSDVAHLVGVSVSAVRKWRLGAESSPQNRQRLAELAGFLEQLSDKAGVSDPAQWLEMEFPLGAGYAVRPVDLYAKGLTSELLDIAEHRTGIAAVLDSQWPSWRTELRSQYEVAPGPDGDRMITIRGTGD